MASRSLRALLQALALLAVLAGGARAGPPEVCGAALEISGPHDRALAETAAALGLDHAEAFVKVATFVDRNGRLPDCYLTKREARERGWRPGRNLWDSAPGAAIGGNRFHNREGRLPDRYTGRYVEADLDFAGTRRRGARRLVFVERETGGWTLWVTLDHYDSFVRIDPR